VAFSYSGDKRINVNMRRLLLLGTFTALATQVLSAGTLLYSNYDDTHPYHTDTGLSVTTDAVPFTVLLSPDLGFVWSLSDIEFAGSANPQQLNPVTATLYDSIGGLPGDVLESWTLTLDPNTAGAPVFQLNSAVNPVLATGQQYWFGLSDPVRFDLTWDDNGIGAQNAAIFDGETWSFNEGQYSQGAFRVNADEVVAATPEPGTMLALASGLLLLGARRRRK
jgi:hypothetical protein